MATDLTEVLLSKQARKYDPDQFGARPELLSDAGGKWNASNYQQMISQGIGNLLGAIDAPAQREAIAREEAIAAEQVQYAREQDALNNELKQRASARGDADLKLRQDAAARQVARDKKADLANQSNSAFQAEAFRLGEDIRSVVQNNKKTIGDLTNAGVLSANADGSFSLSDTATPAQREAFEGIGDVDTKVRDARNSLLKYVANLAGDDIQGNEIGDIQTGLAMLDATYKPSTQATQAENDLYQRKLVNLQAQRDNALAATTGALGNNPELLSIQSDIASMPSGNPTDLGKDLVASAIKGNPNLDNDALAEVNTWRDKAKAGDFGKDIQESVNTPWGEYYLGRAIQQAGGDPYFGFGSFKDGDLARRFRNVLRQTDQVRNVVRQQGEISTNYAAELLKLEQLFKSASTGRAVTK